MVDKINDLIRECAPFTMIEAARFSENVRFLTGLAEQGALPEGAILECGTWKGGMALALTEIFGTHRHFEFFDSFKGLPPPTSRDGDDAHYWARHPEHPRNFNNCAAELEDFRTLLQRMRPEHKDIRIVEGWFSETLDWKEPLRVAFAHLDCDWYDSVMVCLERLWPRIVVGGVILIDDYYDWEGCRRAVHDFLSRMNAREAIRSVGERGGVSITRLGDWTISESPHLQ